MAKRQICFPQTVELEQKDIASGVSLCETPRVSQSFPFQKTLGGENFSKFSKTKNYRACF